MSTDWKTVIPAQNGQAIYERNMGNIFFIAIEINTRANTRWKKS